MNRSIQAIIYTICIYITRKNYCYASFSFPCRPPTEQICKSVTGTNRPDRCGYGWPCAIIAHRPCSCPVVKHITDVTSYGLQIIQDFQCLPFIFIFSGGIDHKATLKSISVHSIFCSSPGRTKSNGASCKASCLFQAFSCVK